MDKKVIYDRLVEYSREGVYPLHMPGHKRNISLLKGIDPFAIDITEIEGFDNLHNAQDIIKKSMDEAAEFFCVKRTWYLVNGSSGGILAAIHCVTNIGDRILIGRNCHKSVYNAVQIRNLDAEYIYPEYIEEYGINGGYNVKKIKNMLEQNPDIKVVVLTSPTYEGIISDIESIAKVIHDRQGILIVDEAHGAHLGITDELPKAAYEVGADIVIESVHKTLPSLTQTAMLHLNSDKISEEKINEALGIYQSSSPSYLFMVSIENSINIAKRYGKKLLTELLMNNKKIIEDVNKTNIHIIGKEIVGKKGVYDFDLTKLVIMSNQNNGGKLADILRKKYNFEVEMEAGNYVLAMTTMCDNLDELQRFKEALIEVGTQKKEKGESFSLQLVENEKTISSYECSKYDTELVDLNMAEGKIAGDYIYLYPPGIPILVPGEKINERVVKQIQFLMEKNLNVVGITDKKMKVIK